MKVNDAVISLAALAQSSRLELFRLLVKRGPDGYTPNEIAEILDIPGSTLSFHLKELVRSGLVKSRKQSRFIYYSPDFAEVNSLMGFLTEHCCSLSTDGDSSCCAPKNLAKAGRRSSTRFATVKKPSVKKS